MRQFGYRMIKTLRYLLTYHFIWLYAFFAFYTSIKFKLWNGCLAISKTGKLDFLMYFIQVIISLR